MNVQKNSLSVRPPGRHGTSGSRDSDGVPASPAGAARSLPERRPYSAPVLEDFGDVRDITLGPSPGVGESGAPTMFRP